MTGSKYEFDCWKCKFQIRKVKILHLHGLNGECPSSSCRGREKKKKKIGPWFKWPSIFFVTIKLTIFFFFFRVYSTNCNLISLFFLCLQDCIRKAPVCLINEPARNKTVKQAGTVPLHFLVNIKFKQFLTFYSTPNSCTIFQLNQSKIKH